MTQIFQKTVSISYGKQSNMGTLQGINVAGQQANPTNELDFQVANTMRAIANDVEFTFLNGTYQDGNYDDVAYKTRGITSAITTNTLGANSEGLGFWLVADIMRSISEANAPTDGLVLMAHPVHIMQLNADASANGLTIVPAAREVNGIKIDQVVTPFGSIGILANARVAKGTALIINPAICAPVDMPVPGKGNFFLEELAKVGAGVKYQVFGQTGLEHGPEWYAGKITGLSTAMPTQADMARRISSVGAAAGAQAAGE